MNNKKFIKIISFILAIIFFAGILFGIIVYIIMGFGTYHKNKNGTINNNHLSNKIEIYEIIIESKKNIEKFKENLNKNKNSIKDIYEIAKNYDKLGYIYNQQNNLSEKEKAYKNAIEYFKLLIKNKNYKILASYKIIELKRKLGFKKESEIILNNLLEKEKDLNIKLYICLSYGIYLKSEEKDLKKAYFYLKKALNLATNNKDKKLIKNYISNI